MTENPVNHWLRLYRRLRRADAVRICLQSLIAAAIAYTLMRALDGGNVTWAVFASLFALQANADRALRFGVGQIVGAVAGTVVGLATLHFFPAASDTLARLGVSTIVTSLSSMFFPATNYSIVVAAAVALEPSTGLSGALSRALAIGLGSIVGIVVSVSVWPRFARSRAFDVMADLLDDCRALLASLSLQSSALHRESIDSIHQRFLRRLIDARLICGDARVRPRLPRGPTLYAILDALETLWHGLVLLDRAVHSQRDALPDRDPLLPTNDVVLKSANAYLQQLAAYMRGEAALPESAPSIQPIRDACTDLQRYIDTAFGDGRREARELHALSTLLFAFQQVTNNLDKIGTLLERRA